MFAKVLVANRGEIAVRVIRALEELGIASVAVYSEIDRDALHVQRADEAYLLGGPTAAESYLNVEKILEVAREAGRRGDPSRLRLPRRERRRSRAPATRPGSSSSARPRARSRRWARRPAPASSCARPGVPIVPGTTEPVATVEDAREIIDAEIGYPVAVKAAGGGGGKGFRVALSEDELAGARSRAPRARARSSSPTRPSTSSATCPTRATSRSRSSPTATAT